MKNFLCFIFLFCISTAYSQDTELFDIYMNYKRQEAACPDVPCLKALLEKEGSKNARENLKKVDKNILAKQLIKGQEIARIRIKMNPYVDSQDVSPDSARLIIKYPDEPGITSAVFFSKEDGVWKIGQ